MTDHPPTRLVRRDHGRGHSYRLDDRKAYGVTTAISRGFPINLKQWGADAAANYAIEHWAELSDLGLAQRLDRMRYAHRDLLAGAALRGSDLHGFGERIVHGETVEIPDEYRGPAEAYARFLDTWEIEPIATETPLANTEYGYAGTADLWARIGVHDGAVALIDLKTGRSVYESVALQLAAYRNADLWQPEAGVENGEVPVAAEVYVAHVLPDDCRLVPVVAGRHEFREFLYVLETARWIDAHGWKSDDPVIGEAVSFAGPRPNTGVAS
jgi:hypothetical protein